MLWSNLLLWGNKATGSWSDFKQAPRSSWFCPKWQQPRHVGMGSLFHTGKPLGRDLRVFKLEDWILFKNSVFSRLPLTERWPNLCKGSLHWDPLFPKNPHVCIFLQAHISLAAPWLLSARCTHDWFPLIANGFLFHTERLNSNSHYFMK